MGLSSLLKTEEWSVSERFRPLPEIQTQFLNNRSVTVLPYSLCNGHVCYNVLLMQFGYVTNSITYCAVRSVSPKPSDDSGHRKVASENFNIMLRAARISRPTLDRSLVWHVA